MNKMSVLGLTFADIDGQIMVFLQTRNSIFPRNRIFPRNFTLYFTPN